MIRVYQKLHDERVRKKLTIDAVAAETKIRPAFLQAIEKGEYQKLPSPTYAEGFVITYAEFLGLSKKDILPLFRREFATDKDVKVLPLEMTEKKPINIHKIHFSGTFFVLVGIFLLLTGFLLFQYRAVFMNPGLSVSSPKNNAVVSSDVIVIGKAESSSDVSINNNQVALDSDGKFTKHLTIFPGPSIIRIIAKNTFGKETVIERKITVR